MAEPQSSQLSPQAQAHQSIRVSPVRPDRRAAHILRLRRIEGQAKGLQRMIDEDQPCLAILTQISAITHALNALGLELVGDHVRGCLDLAAAPAPAGSAEGTTPADADTLAGEIMTALSRLTRS